MPPGGEAGPTALGARDEFAARLESDVHALGGSPRVGGPREMRDQQGLEGLRRGDTPPP